MIPAVRAVAVDFDGTIAERDRADANVLDTLASIRASGVRVVLATGRTLEDLALLLPDATSRFDAIVAENGAILAFSDGRQRALAPTVSAALVEELERSGVPFRRGRVLLATDAVHSFAIVAAIGRLGLDEQILRNRGALMVLPARVSKGRGVDEAFADLGISHHSAIGIGDAENDHALLSTCEIGVAVGNAVDALKARADIVIEKPNPAGLAEWLEGVHAETIPLKTRRRIALGANRDGTPALVPSSLSNALIVGKSGVGKSYLAGLFAERLVRAGYSVCMLDPEGDYTRLGELRGVLTLGGSHPPPAPDELAPIVRHRLGSVVVDLSLLRADERIQYMRVGLKRLMACRAATGLPHWIFVDEAHAALGDDEPFRDLLRQKGVCAITYHPAELAAGARLAADFGLFFPGAEEFTRRLLSRNAARAADAAVRIRELGPRSALYVDLRSDDVPMRSFSIDERITPHVRHRHKYTTGSLSSDHCFEFRDEKGMLLGTIACNLMELESEIAKAPAGSIAHHTRSGDFSRWSSEALQDPMLAASLRAVEKANASDTEMTRHALLRAIHERYAADDLAS